MHAAKRMGVRLVGADKHRGRLDRQRATANQIATAARKVAGPGMFPRAKLTVITDTVGPMPTSKLGNRHLQSWMVKGQPEHIVVTCAPDKSAESSWKGFEVFARERGIELQRDATHQSVELVHDCGAEWITALGAHQQQGHAETRHSVRTISTRWPPGLNTPTAASEPRAGSDPVAAKTTAADLERHAEVEPRAEAEVCVEPRAEAEAGIVATPVGDAGDQQADEAGARDVNAVVALDLGPEMDRVPRRQRRPISCTDFRERLGECFTQCQRAGFVQRSATPHKDRKFEAHPSEGANRQLKVQMRLNLVGSRHRFEHWNLDAAGPCLTARRCLQSVCSHTSDPRALVPRIQPRR